LNEAFTSKLKQNECGDYYRNVYISSDYYDILKIMENVSSYLISQQTHIDEKLKHKSKGMQHK